MITLNDSGISNKGCRFLVGFFYVSLFYYTEEFDNIEKESYLGSSAPPHPVREPKTLSVEVEANFISLYNCIIRLRKKSNVEIHHYLKWA